jgi:RNA polymerase sigma-70 factor (ECF subfamily)
LNTLQHQKNIQKSEECQLADLYFSTIIQTPEAEMFLWQSDIKQALQEAIATLPEKCREVFLLSKMEGLKNREIAAKLNISEKTVERHMSLALSKLRKELDWILQYILFYSIFN